MRNPFRYFNSSPEVIRLAVMLYIWYPLSLRQVEDLLFERGVDICHETVRFWWNRFGPMFAAEIRKRRVHQSIAFATGAGIWMRYLCGSMERCTICGVLWITKARCLKSSPQSAGIAGAALKFLKRAMKRYGRPEVIVTDRLRSYGAAMKDIGVEDRQLLRSVAQQSS